MVRLTQQFVLASDPEVGPTDGRFFGERAGYYIIGGEGGGYRTGNRDIYICIYVYLFSMNNHFRSLPTELGGPWGPLGVPGSTVFRVFRILCASQRLTGSQVPWGPVGAMRLFVRDVVGQTLSLQVEGQVRDRGICPRDGHVGKPVL